MGAKYSRNPKAPPDPLARREILYGPETPREALIAYGNLYLRLERPYDALDFFEQARDAEGLGQVKAWALKEGEVYVLLRLRKGTLAPVGEEDLRSTAQIARSKGWASASAAVLGEPEKKKPETTDATDATDGEQEVEP